MSQKKRAPINSALSYKFCFKEGCFIQLKKMSQLLTFTCFKNRFVSWFEVVTSKCNLQWECNFTTFCICFVCGQSNTQQKNPSLSSRLCLIIIQKNVYSAPAKLSAKQTARAFGARGISYASALLARFLVLCLESSLWQRLKNCKNGSVCKITFEVISW